MFLFLSVWPSSGREAVWTYPGLLYLDPGPGTGPGFSSPETTEIFWCQSHDDNIRMNSRSASATTAWREGGCFSPSHQLFII